MRRYLFDDSFVVAAFLRGGFGSGAGRLDVFQDLVVGKGGRLGFQDLDLGGCERLILRNGMRMLIYLHDGCGQCNGGCLLCKLIIELSRRINPARASSTACVGATCIIQRRTNIIAFRQILNTISTLK